MWMQQQYDLFKKSYFNVSYRRCMPRTLAWRRAGLDHACQSGNMAILLTSLMKMKMNLLGYTCTIYNSGYNKQCNAGDPLETPGGLYRGPPYMLINV